MTEPESESNDRESKLGGGGTETFAIEHEVAETELIFGLVGALGTDMDRVTREVHLALEEMDYQAQEIRLSSLLREIDQTDVSLNENAKLDSYLATHMDAGDQLRSDWQRPDALALLAIAKIASERDKLLEAAQSLSRRAWILRQLKTPEEAQTLREVYGSRFFLIAAYTPDDERAEWLIQAVTDSRRSSDHSKWEVDVEELLRRDQSEEKAFGQNVRDTFHRADLFVNAGRESNLRPQIDRVLEIVLANPFKTPTKDEFALFEAYGAARMSSEPGRQVGAALVNEQGEIIALGTNEVPRPGGGVYREGSNEPGVPDQREFRFGASSEALEIDTNDRVQREIAGEIAETLRRGDRDWLADNVDPDELLAVMLTTRLGDLTEFGRAMHAEMSAILDAARNGRAVAGASLYVTTFPCHNCARHIVGAGIRNCVFLAPYAKSQAAILHSDALVVERSAPELAKVSFEPFVGVAPRRYSELFTWARRKNGDGSLLKWDPRDAKPRYSDSESPELRQGRPAYRVHEYLIMALLTKLQSNPGPRLR
jgi:cytidine deaminase